MLYWSNCLIGVSSFWNGLLFFFRPPAYFFAKKRTLNNELTKGGLKGALRLHFRRRVFDAKTKVGEREDPSNKNESPEAIESSRKTTFEFRRASADDVMRD